MTKKSQTPLPENFSKLLLEIEQAFHEQLARLRSPNPTHSPGVKKPTLDEQEAKLLGVTDGPD